MTIIGRVTQGECGDPLATRKGVPGVRLLLEDGTQVVTDRDGLYHVEGAAPRHSCRADRYRKRAADAGAGLLRHRYAPGAQSALALHRGARRQPAARRFPAASERQERRGRPPRRCLSTIASDADAAGNRSDWLAQATPGVDWMFPLADHNPRAPALRVVIRHAPGQRIALTVNGTPIDPLAFDGTDEDKARGVAVSTWTGLPLGDKDNVLEARVLDADGQLVTTLTRTVHYANAAAHVVYVPEKSRLDRRRPDPSAARGARHRSRRASRSAPARWCRSASISPIWPRRRPICSRAASSPASITARRPRASSATTASPSSRCSRPRRPAPSTSSRTLRVEDKDATVDFKAWLAATQKDWVVVGFGKGTVGYAMLRKHSQAAVPGDSGFTSDGQIAFYAKGRIKGSWLLTLAYDSDKKIDYDRGLLGTIDPDRYYTVYGDGTQQSYDAATKRKLYVRLERKEFYALFGDYTTGFTDTKLGRYDRTLNGVKAEYQGQRRQLHRLRRA